MSIPTRSSIETGLVVDIECHITNGLPAIVIVGFASRSTEEAKDRLRGAFRSSQLRLPRKRITVNLAPGDIPKAGTSFDLAIAVAILGADQQLVDLPASTSVTVGELGLDGAVRPVPGIIGKLLTAREQGLCDCFIPAGNLTQAQLVPGLRLYPVHSLRQLFLHLSHTVPLQPLSSGQSPPPLIAKSKTSIDDISGQAQAKRALQISAAGGHHLLLSGPPGTGKSMLAQALPSLLPAMSQEEMLQVTHLQSLATTQFHQVVTQRPLRRPHHSSTAHTLLGGKIPGDIALSCHGVLLLDELPEFSRAAIEALRQPLESQSIYTGGHTLRANFIMVATANPCPCGFYGSDRCLCSPYLVLRYQQRLSGPILDRIDLFSPIEPPQHQALLHTTAATDTGDIREHIRLARQRQLKRSGGLNAHLSNQAVKKQLHLSPAARSLLNAAAKRLKISARGYFKTLKVAQTVADLADSEQIELHHITEALQFRYNPP